MRWRYWPTAQLLVASQWADTLLLHVFSRAPELRWGSYVSGRWTSSQYVQCMECSKTPLNLESSHVEASAPRARLFRRVSSGLLSLQRVFRGLRSPEYEETTLWSGSFNLWCGGRQLDPVGCLIGTVLEFLQTRSSAGLTHSTLKVYVVGLLAYCAPLGGQSVGRHPLVKCFLQSARAPLGQLCEW